MRSIGFKDINGNDIFEGDTVSFNVDDMLSHFNFIEFLCIDKIIAYVIPLYNQVGVKVEFHFFSNDKEVYTYNDKYQILLFENKNDPSKISDINDWYNSLNVSSDSIAPFVLSESEDLNFYHVFAHSDKVIINTSDDNDKIFNFDLKDLVLRINEHKYPTNQSFKVKLTESAKELVLKSHNSFYGFDKFTGDFSHLVFRTNNLSLSSHHFNVEAIDENGNNSLFGVQDSREKRYLEKVRVLNPILKVDAQWKKDNENKLNKEEFNIQWKKRLDNQKNVLTKINNTEYKEDVLIKDIFLGFIVSDNVLQFLSDKDCLIELI